LALIENVVREDLTAIEQARTLAVLLGDLRMTGEVLARRLGRNRADIVNTVRLLDLPDEAIELIDSGALSKGHGKALWTEGDHHRRRVVARQAADGGWSVRTLEAEIARSARPPAPRCSAAAPHAASANSASDQTPSPNLTAAKPSSTPPSAATPSEPRSSRSNSTTANPNALETAPGTPASSPSTTRQPRSNQGAPIYDCAALPTRLSQRAA
jgi:hypothetical protein